ncbi:epoxide hydrolase family protein [Frondihabitans cladoniiphilus]
MSDSPTPFTIPVDSDALADLRARLRATRWPDAPEDAGWSLGADLGTLRELVAYWIDGFDWEAQVQALSTVPHFRANLGGTGGVEALGVHYVHVAAAPGGASPAMPLLLAHGWPDSFWRFGKVIPLLTDPGAHGGDPADAFDVIVPDMPGYGYSDRPTGPALDTIGVAKLWAELMTALGYDRFGAAGGDIGSGVVRYLALDFPSRVVGVHRIDANLAAGAADAFELTPEEKGFAEQAAEWNAAEGAYGHLHRTKPQTGAFGLNDSPVGLLAWIVEKMQSWSDGELEAVYTKDEILTNVTIYWLTETIGSSMRMYQANAAIPVEQQLRRVEVPSGFSLFPGDLLHPPKAWLERSTNLVSLHEMPRGGHFAAFEEPELYARELRDFFRPLRTAAV